MPVPLGLAELPQLQLCSPPPAVGLWSGAGLELSVRMSSWQHSWGLFVTRKGCSELFTVLGVWKKEALPAGNQENMRLFRSIECVTEEGRVARAGWQTAECQLCLGGAGRWGMELLHLWRARNWLFSSGASRDHCSDPAGHISSLSRGWRHEVSPQVSHWRHRLCNCAVPKEAENSELCFGADVNKKKKPKKLERRGEQGDGI